jgi:hypothetical protein
MNRIAKVLVALCVAGLVTVVPLATTAGAATTPRSAPATTYHQGGCGQTCDVLLAYQENYRAQMISGEMKVHTTHGTRVAWCAVSVAGAAIGGLLPGGEEEGVSAGAYFLFYCGLGAALSWIATW